MKYENKSEYTIKGNIGCNGDIMSFGEIAKHMDISEAEVKRIYDGAIRKLKQPGMSRELWDYLNIGDVSDDEADYNEGYF